jgi:hypothetical protein
VVGTQIGQTVTAIRAGATRSILLSPFPGDGDTVYFAGYDADKAPALNTAWIARAALSAALEPSR